MSERKPTVSRRRDRDPRRTFSVRGQLLGKLGQDGLDSLITSLERTTRRPRRRRGNRKVSA